MWRLGISGAGGAGEGNRTPDLLLTMEALCRLSYSGGSLDVVTIRIGRFGGAV